MSGKIRAKLVVLYPKPVDEEEFEEQYWAQHLPLMRTLAGPEIPIVTYRVRSASDARPVFYRVAEIHFPDMNALREFVRSDETRVGQASALKVSTGGPPISLLCEAD